MSPYITEAQASLSRLSSALQAHDRAPARLTAHVHAQAAIASLKTLLKELPK